MVKFQIGDTVRLSKSVDYIDAGAPTTAVVRSGMSDIAGGLRLDAPLGGCRYWNEDDLVLVKKAPGQPKLSPAQQAAYSKLQFFGQSAVEMGVSTSTLRALEAKGLARALPEHGGALGFMTVGAASRSVRYCKVAR